MFRYINNTNLFYIANELKSFFVHISLYDDVQKKTKNCIRISLIGKALCYGHKD